MHLNVCIESVQSTWRIVLTVPSLEYALFNVFMLHYFSQTTCFALLYHTRHWPPAPFTLLPSSTLSLAIHYLLKWIISPSWLLSILKVKVTLSSQMLETTFKNVRDHNQKNKSLLLAAKCSRATSRVRIKTWSKVSVSVRASIITFNNSTLTRRVSQKDFTLFNLSESFTS